MVNNPPTRSSPPVSILTPRFGGPRSRAWSVTDRAIALERGGRKVFHLGVGDPDFDTPAVVTDAAIRALKNGRTHYAPISGEPTLCEVIAKRTGAVCGATIDPREVTVFPGAQCALFATLLCLAGADDEVMLLEPFYATYEGVAAAGGARPTFVPLPAKTGFRPDIELIRDNLTAKTRVIIANSPGNPSGAVFSRNHWEALVELCENNDIWLVSDEVYGDLVYEGEHVSPRAFSESHVVVINSVSKSYAMTGWRLGWTVAPAVLSEHLGNIAQCLTFGVNQFVQDAATVALGGSQHALETMRETLRSRRDAFCAALQPCKELTIHKPAGGMFILIDVSRLGTDGEAFANALLDQTGVAVVPGFAFGDAMTNYVRIGFLLDTAELKIAADRIIAFVSSNFS